MRKSLIFAILFILAFSSAMRFKARQDTEAGDAPEAEVALEGSTETSEEETTGAEPATEPAAEAEPATETEAAIEPTAEAEPVAEGPQCVTDGNDRFFYMNNCLYPDQTRILYIWVANSEYGGHFREEIWYIDPAEEFECCIRTVQIIAQGTVHYDPDPNCADKIELRPDIMSPNPTYQQ